MPKARYEDILARAEELRKFKVAHDISMTRLRTSKVTFSFGTPLERALAKIMEKTRGCDVETLYTEIVKDCRFDPVPENIDEILSAGVDNKWVLHKGNYMCILDIIQCDDDDEEVDSEFDT